MIDVRPPMKPDGFPTEDEIKEALKTVTPESVKARIEEMEQDDEDRRCLRGKHAPPDGVCRVCGDRVIAEVRFAESAIIGGPPPNACIKNWSCYGCGIMYSKPPPMESEEKGSK